MQRKRYTAKEKFELVNKYYSEGSSQRAFCKKYDIDKSTLSVWLKKYREANSEFQDITPIIKDEKLISNNNVVITIDKIKIEFDVRIIDDVLRALK